MNQPDPEIEQRTRNVRCLVEDDPLFRAATPPPGWSRQATDRRLYSQAGGDFGDF